MGPRFGIEINRILNISHIQGAITDTGYQVKYQIVYSFWIIGAKRGVPPWDQGLEYTNRLSNIPYIQGAITETGYPARYPAVYSFWIIGGKEESDLGSKV